MLIYAVGGTVGAVTGSRISRGVQAALLAAFLFGAGTPIAKTLLGTVSPWLLAGLLYATVAHSAPYWLGFAMMAAAAVVLARVRFAGMRAPGAETPAGSGAETASMPDDSLYRRPAFTDPEVIA